MNSAICNRTTGLLATVLLHTSYYVFNAYYNVETLSYIMSLYIQHEQSSMLHTPLSIEQQYDLLGCMSMIRLLSKRCPSQIIPNSCIVWHPEQRRMVSSGYNTSERSCEQHALEHVSWLVARKCWLLINYFPMSGKIIRQKGIKNVYYMEPIGGGGVSSDLTSSGVLVHRIVNKS